MKYIKPENALISWRAAFFKIFLVLLLIFSLLLPLGCGKKGPPTVPVNMKAEAAAELYFLM